VRAWAARVYDSSAAGSEINPATEETAGRTIAGHRFDVSSAFLAEEHPKRQHPREHGRKRDEEEKQEEERKEEEKTNNRTNERTDERTNESESRCVYERRTTFCRTSLLACRARLRASPAPPFTGDRRFFVLSLLPVPFPSP